MCLDGAVLSSKQVKLDYGCFVKACKYIRNLLTRIHGWCHNEGPLKNWLHGNNVFTYIQNGGRYLDDMVEDSFSNVLSKSEVCNGMFVTTVWPLNGSGSAEERL